MGYTLDTSQKAPLLDGDDNPLATAGVTDPAGNPPPFAPGVATIRDDGHGFLELVANTEGAVTFALKKNGTTTPHEVTVTAAAFDWTLGQPVAK